MTNYADVIEQAAESEIKSAFAVLLKGLAGKEDGAVSRFATALALIEQARVAALGIHQPSELEK